MSSASLPNEIILEILSYLDDSEYWIAFAAIFEPCPRFRKYTSSFATRLIALVLTNLAIVKCDVCNQRNNSVKYEPSLGVEVCTGWGSDDCIPTMQRWMKELDEEAAEEMATGEENPIDFKILRDEE